MAIKLNCPQCGQMMRLHDEHVGKRVKCPQNDCGHRFIASLDPEPEAEQQEQPMFPGEEGGDGGGDQPSGDNSALDLLNAAMGGGEGRAPTEMPDRRPEDSVGGRSREVRPRPSLRPDSSRPTEEVRRDARPVAPRPRIGSDQPSPVPGPSARPQPAPPRGAPQPPKPQPAGPAAARGRPAPMLEDLAAALNQGGEGSGQRQSGSVRPSGEEPAESGSQGDLGDLAAALNQREGRPQPAARPPARQQETEIEEDLIPMSQLSEPELGEEEEQAAPPPPPMPTPKVKPRAVAIEQPMMAAPAAAAPLPLPLPKAPRIPPPPEPAEKPRNLEEVFESLAEGKPRPAAEAPRPAAAPRPAVPAAPAAFPPRAAPVVVMPVAPAPAPQAGESSRGPGAVMQAVPVAPQMPKSHAAPPVPVEAGAASKSGSSGSGAVPASGAPAGAPGSGGAGAGPDGAAPSPVGPVGIQINAPIPAPARLDGNEIYLRPPTAADLSAFAKWFEDANALRTSTGLRALSAARQNGDFDAATKVNGGVTMVICLKENGVAIGCTGLYDIDWRNRSARFEFNVGTDSQVSGKGFRSDAARTIVEFGFRELNLHRQYILLYDNTPRGRRVYSMIGFAEEGKLKQAYFCDGRFYDVQVWGVLAAAYYEKRRQDGVGAPGAAGGGGEKEE